MVRTLPRRLLPRPLNPDQDDRDWVRDAWERLAREDALSLKTSEPGWLDRPALTRFTASHPRLLRPFAALNHDKPYTEQVKPANFLLVAHTNPAGYPKGADPKRFALIAPYESEPGKWGSLPWRNVYDPDGPRRRDPWRGLVLPVIPELPLRTTVQATGLSPAGIKNPGRTQLPAP